MQRKGVGKKGEKKGDENNSASFLGVERQ